MISCKAPDGVNNIVSMQFEVTQHAACSTNSPNYYGLKAGTDVSKNAADLTIDYKTG